MADTPKVGEIDDQGKLKNDAIPPTPPIEEKKTDDSEVEAQRKKAEQAEMRANQLANELKAIKDAQAVKDAKELEDKEEFKTLYEQEKVKREEIEREAETEKERKALKKAEKAVLSEYSDEVKDAAEDLGVTLGDAGDDAVAEFKGKLDKLQARVGGTRMAPNNPGKSSGQKEYTREQMYEILNDPEKRDAYYRSKGGVTAQMMGPQN